MNDKVVIAGTVKLRNTIKAKTNLHNVINGTPSWVVNTGGGSQPTGTKSILLTEAGTKTEDVASYAYAEINAVTDATASGAIASFSDGAEDVPMDSCVVNIEPVQSGSGDPSPSNVRPISGWSEVKVYVSPTLSAQDATVYHISLGQTVYGGTLDVVTGVLTVDRRYTELSENWLWRRSSSYQGGYYCGMYPDVPTMKPQTPFMCSHAKTATRISEYVDGTCYCDGSINIRIMSASSTLQDWKDYIVAQRENGTPVEICYPLATPTTVQLTPTEVTTLLGSNSVWADSGDISVGYKADVYLSEGGVTPTGTKQININSNGTTTEDVTNYANAEINVNVPASAVDTGTKNINSNGTHDVVGYANASVNVPNSYSQSDEGKVVSNGALVAQTSDTVTANDTYDTTLINSLTVNVSGGGGLDINDVAMGTVPSGALVLDTATSIAKFAFRSNTNITSVSAPNVTSVGEHAFNGCTNITSVNLPNVTTTGQNMFESTGIVEFSLPKATSIANYAIRSCASLKRLFLPNLGAYSGIGGYGLQNCRSLEVIDFGLANVGLPSMPANTPLHTLILRRTTVATLGANGLNNSTAFANGGTGGDIYIPKSLYDQLGTGTNDYKSATNWSAYDGYGTITWHAIEGSEYEL